MKLMANRFKSMHVKPRKEGSTMLGMYYGKRLIPKSKDVTNIMTYLYIYVYYNSVYIVFCKYFYIHVYVNA